MYYRLAEFAVNLVNNIQIAYMLPLNNYRWNIHFMIF